MSSRRRQWHRSSGVRGEPRGDSPIRTPQESLALIVRALNEADASVLDAVIAEDVVYEIYGEDGISGTYRSRQAFIDMWAWCWTRPPTP